MKNNDRVLNWMADVTKVGGVIMWVQIYKKAVPTESDVDRFTEAFGKLVKRHAKSIKSSDVESLPPHKNAAWNSFPMAVRNDAMRRTLLNIGAFTYRNDSWTETFFFSPSQSFGSTVIVDVKNGPPVEDTMVEMFVGAFSDLLETRKPEKEEKKAAGKKIPSNALWFKDLRYQKVPTRDTQKGSKAVIWRFVFKPKDSEFKPRAIPSMIGQTPRGDVLVEVPTFCPHCVSYSHHMSSCQWWKESGVSGSKNRPKIQFDTEWKHVRWHKKVVEPIVEVEEEAAAS
ncbi:hypothetical protein FRC03_012174 [Tulasnella sp. 419]|nr:hypothetical protein FRC03_012174 [Tulasnella sp. 419]